MTRGSRRAVHSPGAPPAPPRGTPSRHPRRRITPTPQGTVSVGSGDRGYTSSNSSGSSPRTRRRCSRSPRGARRRVRSPRVYGGSGWGGSSSRDAVPHAPSLTPWGRETQTLSPNLQTRRHETCLVTDVSWSLSRVEGPVVPGRSGRSGGARTSFPDGPTEDTPTRDGPGDVGVHSRDVRSSGSYSPVLRPILHRRCHNEERPGSRLKE